MGGGCVTVRCVMGLTGAFRTFGFLALGTLLNQLSTDYRNWKLLKFIDILFFWLIRTDRIGESGSSIGRLIEALVTCTTRI